MELPMKVWQKNHDRFQTKKSDIVATAKSTCGQYVAMEYKSSSNGGTVQTAIGTVDGTKIWHYCRAISGRRPCWHLAGLAHLMGLSLPADVTVLQDERPPKIDNWVDTTPEYLGRAGTFQVLHTIQTAASNTPTATATATPKVSNAIQDEIDKIRTADDDELDRYNLPERVLLRVLQFRRSQEEKIENGLLTSEQVARIPRITYVPQGKEVIYGLSSLTFPSWVGALAVGPKGSGKNTFVKALFGAMKLPMTRILGGLDMNGEALLGGKTLEPETVPLEDIDRHKLRAAANMAGVNIDGILKDLGTIQMKIGFEPGLLLEAVEKGEGLFFDEINFSLAEVLCLTNGLIGMQKILAVPGKGIVNAPESFRFAAAMNHGYAGTRPLNQALQDRLRVLEINHLPEEALAEVLVNETDCAKERAESVAKVFHLLAGRVANGDLSDNVLSVRALKYILWHDMDEIEPLPRIAASCLTEGLTDLAEKDIVTDIVEAYLA